MCQQQCVSACAGWSLSARVLSVCVCVTHGRRVWCCLVCVCVAVAVAAEWFVLLYAAVLLLLRVVADSVCVFVCTHPYGVQVLNKVPIHTKGLVAVLSLLLW